MSLYNTYGDFKAYSTPRVDAKHVRRMDREFWVPAACERHHSVLEVGCGTGLFLAYLHAKGVADFIGVDLDPNLAAVVPDAVRDRFVAADVWDFLDGLPDGRRFDRIVLFDVLEHFSVSDAGRLIAALGERLSAGGRIVIKVPNAGSPWGLQFQFGDLTHLTAFTPGSLRQLAIDNGFKDVGCHPHFLGSPIRRVLDRALHAVLDRVVMTPPEIWTANFLAVLTKG